MDSLWEMYPNVFLELGEYPDIFAVQKEIEKHHRLAFGGIERLLFLGTSLIKVNITMRLFSVTVKEMGYLRGATTGNLYETAAEYGWSLCPQETGPLLMCHPMKQELLRGYDRAIIASDYIGDGSGTYLFYVQRWRNIYQLCFFLDNVKNVWESEVPFIFCLKV